MVSVEAVIQVCLEELGMDASAPYVVAAVGRVNARMGGSVPMPAAMPVIAAKPKRKVSPDVASARNARLGDWNTFCGSKDDPESRRRTVRAAIDAQHPEWSKTDRARACMTELSKLFKVAKAAATAAPAPVEPAAPDSVDTTSESETDEAEEGMQPYVDSDGILGDKGEEYAVDDDGKIWNTKGAHVGNMDDGTVSAV